MKRLSITLLFMVFTQAMHCSSSESSKRSKDDKIIIVGAGAAGIAAATRLIDLGYENLIILEARNRIGGRVWTDDSTGTPLDMGASWIHGVTDNPMTEISDEYDIARSKFTDYDSHSVYHLSEGALSDATIESQTQTLLSDLAAIAEYGETLDNDTSLQSGFENLNLLPTGANDLEKYQYFINTEIEHEYTGDIDSMSLWWWNEAGEYDGGDVIFPSGMNQMLQALYDDYKLDNYIHLEQRVVSIDYSSSLTVTTEDQTYSGDAVVVTVPLGVLKAGHINFEPQLPATKQAAIDNLGFDVLNKLYLEFQTVFWEAEDIIGYIDSTKGRWAEWLNIHNHDPTKKFLLGFNAAEYGNSIEDMTDGEIVDDAMQVLRNIYPGAPDPTNYSLTRWGQDEFTLGSYSYTGVNASPESYDELFEPVEDTLFFAGEATHSEHPGTVHGAILSGRSAAQKIAGD